MANGFTTVGTNDVNVLISGVNQQLNSTLKTMELTYRKIARTDSTSNAKTMHYPFEVSAYYMKPRLAFSTPEYTKPQIVDITVDGQDFETPIRMQSLGAFDDPYSLVKAAIADSLRSVTKLWDIELAALINRNGLAYDGRPFFGPHNSNPAAMGRPDYNNVISGAPPNKTGFLKAFNSLQQRIGYDGNRLFPDVGRRDVICVVPTEDMKISLAEVLNEGMYPTPVGAGAAASATTHLVGYAQDIVVMPELFDTSVPGSDSRWYMVVTKLDMRPAFIVRDYKQPQFMFIAPKEYLDYERFATGFVARASGGAGYALPQSIVQCNV